MACGHQHTGKKVKFVWFETLISPCRLVHCDTGLEEKVTQDACCLQSSLVCFMSDLMFYYCRGLRRLDWIRLQKTAPVGSMICVPILASQRVVGILNIAAESPEGVCRYGATHTRSLADCVVQGPRGRSSQLHACQGNAL